jgi:Photosynthetic reaction centre cytochrome C subunit
MKLRSWRTTFYSVPIAVVFLMSVALAGAQTAPANQVRPAGSTLTAKAQTAARLAAGQTHGATTAQKPLMAGEFFKNVQALKDIPVDEFMGTMGFMAASLSLNCLDCHLNEAASDFSRYADDTPIKKKAREMVVMMRDINKTHFGGARMVTCYTCHRSDVRAKITPSLQEQYGTPPPDDPHDVEFIQLPPAGAPTAAQILDRYVEAIGGAQKLAGFTSFAAKGTYAGWDTDFGKTPAEVFAKAPAQRTTIVHFAGGESTESFDGKNAWIAALQTQLPLDALTGGQLDAARLEAEMFFPGQIKQALTNWRVGFAPITIVQTRQTDEPQQERVDEREVNVVQGNAGKSRVKFFFDKQTGLLLRWVLFANTAIGLNPMEVDYSDYRDVAGVKMPFRWTMNWTDGRSEFALTDVQPNVAVDPAKFGKPVVPAARSAKAATP